MKYEPDIRKAYSDVEHEWNRLNKDTYHKLELGTTLKYLTKYLPKNGRVLELGSGPGRYSVILARKGYKLSVLDITPEFLGFARRRLKSHGLIKNVERFVEGSITDLSMFEDNCFDAVLCLGGALSHVSGKAAREKAAKEIIRVAKNNAPIFVSVFNRISVMASLVVLWSSEMRTPGAYKKFFEKGDDYQWYKRHYAHFFLPDEFANLFANKEVKQLALVGLEGANEAAKQSINNMPRHDKKAWKNWISVTQNNDTSQISIALSAHILLVLRKAAKR